MTSPRKNNKSVASSSRPYRRGIAAGLLVVVLGGAVVWWFAIQPTFIDMATSTKHPQKIANNAMPVTSQTDFTIRTVAHKKSKDDYDPATLKERLKNSTEKIAKAKIEPGRCKLDAPVIKDTTDQLYFAIFSTQLGDMPPMMPKLQPKEEKEALLNINNVLQPDEEDDDFTVNAKLVVNQAKEELKNYLLETDGTINDFLEKYSNLLELYHDKHSDAQQAFNKICKDTISGNENREVVRAYYDKVSKLLADEGIKPLVLSRVQKKLLGIMPEDELMQKGATK